jgi:surface protein
MGGMFSGCSSLTSLDVSGFKTDNVTNMGGMFSGCSGLTNLDVSGFKTDNVTDMGYMFYKCSGLTSLDVSGFKTDNVTNMRAMFCGCSGLTNLDVSSFKTDNVKDMDWMFSGCNELNTIYASEKWNMSNVVESSNMFSQCYKLTGGAGTTYQSTHTNGDYAHIDGGLENPGYFTYKESTNAIHSVKANEDNGSIYGLSGVRLRLNANNTDGLNSGIYIVKGKKLMVK